MASSLQLQTEEWYLLDAQDRILGRLASELASILRGKHKPTFSPHRGGGDFIVVLNAEKVRLTGNKAKDKKYFRYSTRPGHKKEMNFEELNEKKPGEALRLAVRGMLPKNHLGRELLKRLKVYAGADHPHQAQQPSLLSFSAKGTVVVPKASQAKAKPQQAETVAPAAEKAETVAPAAEKSETVAPAAEKPATVAPAAEKSETVAPAAVKPETVAPAAEKPEAAAAENAPSKDA
jgi:large subunit ribosomal protein L13